MLDLIASFDNVIFIATPHDGSTLATLAGKASHLIRLSEATMSLPKGDAHLADLKFWYKDWSYSRIDHLVLYETKPTKRFGVVFCKTVEAGSADPGLVGCRPSPLNCSHVEAAQVGARTNEVYIEVSHFIIDNDQQALRVASQSVEEIQDGIKSLVSIADKSADQQHDVDEIVSQAYQKDPSKSLHKYISLTFSIEICIKKITMI